MLAALQSKERNGVYRSTGSLPIVGHVKQERGLWAASLGGVILGCALFAAIRHPWMASAEYVEVTPIPSKTVESEPVPVKEILNAVDTSVIKTKRTRPHLPLRKAEAEKLVQKWQVR